MDPTIAATVIGVLLSVCFAAFATAFAWLRTDIDARFDKLDDKVDARFDKLDDKVDTRFDKMDDKVDTRFDKMDTRFDRLEAKVDGLIMTLARSGLLTEPDDSGASD